MQPRKGETMIHVIATIEVAEGKREAFLEEFRELVPLVRAEAGCLDYGPTVDADSGLSAQGPARAGVAVIAEKWEGLGALKAHLQAPHMADYRTHVKDFVREVGLQVLRPA